MSNSSFLPDKLDGLSTRIKDGSRRRERRPPKKGDSPESTWGAGGEIAGDEVEVGFLFIEAASTMSFDFIKVFQRARRNFLFTSVSSDVVVNTTYFFILRENLTGFMSVVLLLSLFLWDFYFFSQNAETISSPETKTLAEKFSQLVSEPFLPQDPPSPPIY